MDSESIDVSDGGEGPSVEIIGEDSCGENDNDQMDSIDVQSAGSKNGKTSEFGEKTEKCGPLDLEDSDSDVVYLGEEGVGEGGGGGFVSDSSYETDTLLSSEEESAHSDDEDYDPEESESSEFSEESSSSGGDGQWSDESDADMKKGENANKREKKKGSGKAKKGEGVQDNIEVNKVHYIDEGEVKRGFRKEGKGKNVEGGVEVKKGQHSSRKDVTALLLKFCFGSKEPSVPEKPELDPEENELWDEFRFSLRSCDIGSTGSNKVGWHKFIIHSDLEST